MIRAIVTFGGHVPAFIGIAVCGLPVLLLGWWAFTPRSRRWCEHCGGDNYPGHYCPGRRAKRTVG